jgi:hypothetical protein
MGCATDGITIGTDADEVGQKPRLVRGFCVEGRGRAWPPPMEIDHEIDKDTRMRPLVITHFLDPAADALHQREIHAVTSHPPPGGTSHLRQNALLPIPPFP